jgi:hypothetical protein
LSSNRNNRCHPIIESSDDSSIGEIDLLVNNKTNESKKRRLFENRRSTTESRITSSHADSILEVESEKLDLARKKLALKRIKTSAPLKKLEAKGVDVTKELDDLNKINV